VSSGPTFPLIGSLAILDVDGDAEPEILAGEWAYPADPNAGTRGQVAIYRRTDGYVTPVRTVPSALSDGLIWA
jgi:hypothetical protein